MYFQWKALFLKGDQALGKENNECMQIRKQRTQSPPFEPGRSTEKKQKKQEKKWIQLQK